MGLHYNHVETSAERVEEKKSQTLKFTEVRRWVQSRIQPGERFKAPHDAYNYQSVRDPAGDTDRMVVAFYAHYVLTVDDFGKNETYQYYDMMEMLRRQGK